MSGQAGGQSHRVHLVVKAGLQLVGPCSAYQVLGEGKRALWDRGQIRRQRLGRCGEVVIGHNPPRQPGGLCLGRRKAPALCSLSDNLEALYLIECTPTLRASSMSSSVLTGMSFSGA